VPLNGFGARGGVAWRSGDLSGPAHQVGYLTLCASGEPPAAAEHFCSGSGGLPCSTSLKIRQGCSPKVDLAQKWVARHLGLTYRRHRLLAHKQVGQDEGTGRPRVARTSSRVSPPARHSAGWPGRMPPRHAGTPSSSICIPSTERVCSLLRLKPRSWRAAVALQERPARRRPTHGNSLLCFHIEHDSFCAGTSGQM
jgi:hypothetical protein